MPPESEAEPADSVISRIESAMYDLALAYPGKTVALILHGASIRCLLKRAVGNTRIKTPKNVSLTTMAVGPGPKWRLVQVADSSHTPKMTKDELLHKLRALKQTEADSPRVVPRKAPVVLPHYTETPMA